MSFQAMSWATEQELPAMQKIVLLMLANRTNHDTGLCYPSHETLVKECGMSKSSIIRQIELLESAGLLKVIRSTNSKGEKNPNRYKLNLTVGSVTETLGGSVTVEVGSVTETHKPVIKPKRTVVVTGEREKVFLTFDDLTDEQKECWHWALTVPYWSSSTSSIENFKQVYDKDSPKGLRAQFDAHKKALQDGRGQTGLDVHSENLKKTTGANYATHYQNHKKPTAAEVAKSLRERANAADGFVPVASNDMGYNGEFVANANAQILVCDD